MFEDLFIYNLGVRISDSVENDYRVAIDGLRELLLKLVDRVVSGGVEKPHENVDVAVAKTVRVIRRRFGADVHVGRGRYVKVSGVAEYELTSNIMVRIHKAGRLNDVELKVVYESTRGGHIGIFAKLRVVSDDVCSVENPRSEGDVHVVGPITINKNEEEVMICGKSLDYDESGINLEKVRYLYAWEWEDVSKELKL